MAFFAFDQVLHLLGFISILWWIFASLFHALGILLAYKFITADEVQNFLKHFTLNFNILHSCPSSSMACTETLAHAGQPIPVSLSGNAYVMHTEIFSQEFCFGLIFRRQTIAQRKGETLKKHSCCMPLQSIHLGNLRKVKTSYQIKLLPYINFQYFNWQLYIFSLLFKL